jgi:RNA polymerase sigma-70 factor (ECF subfamily)
LDEITHIIEGCKKNDRLSQEKLYRQFYPALYALCKTFFENNHDILTALNNGMLRVYKNIERFDQNKGALFNWVYTIVRNAAITLVKDKIKEIRMDLFTDDLAENAIYNPFREKEWHDIYLLLGKLPHTTRAICSLYYMEGFSIRDISVALEMKEATVKWHLHEGRKRLKMIAQPNVNECE